MVDERTIESFDKPFLQDMSFRKTEKAEIQYEMDFPPMGIDYDSWDKRTADKYFKWFIEQIPLRTEYLRKRIAGDSEIDISQLDYTLESLVPVWDWYIKNAVIEKTPKEELKK